MNPTDPLSWYQQFGMSGCIVLAMCYTLYLVITKLMPLLAETNAKRLDKVVDGIDRIIKQNTDSMNKLLNVLMKRLDKTDDLLKQGHDDLSKQIHVIEEKIDSIRHSPQQGPTP